MRELQPKGLVPFTVSLLSEFGTVCRTLGRRMTVNGWTFEFARHTHIQHTSSPQERPEAMTFERDLTESMIATLDEEYSRNGGGGAFLRITQTL